MLLTLVGGVSSVSVQTTPAVPVADFSGFEYKFPNRYVLLGKRSIEHDGTGGFIASLTDDNSSVAQDSTLSSALIGGLMSAQTQQPKAGHDGNEMCSVLSTVIRVSEMTPAVISGVLSRSGADDVGLAIVSISGHPPGFFFVLKPGGEDIEFEEELVFLPGIDYFLDAFASLPPDTADTQAVEIAAEFSIEPGGGPEEPAACLIIRV